MLGFSGSLNATARLPAMDFQLDMETDTVIEASSPTQPVVVAPETTLREVLQQMREQNTGSVFVIRDGKLVGIYTERDALKLMANAGELDVPVYQVMIRDPITVQQNDKVADAVTRMSLGGYRRLPIVDENGQPTGAVKASGILRYMVDHFPQSIYTLPPEPNNASKEREGA